MFINSIFNAIERVFGTTPNAPRRLETQGPRERHHRQSGKGSFKQNKRAAKKRSKR